MDPGFTLAGGPPAPKVGVLTYYFGRKLQENERIWTPLDPLLQGALVHLFRNLPVQIFLLLLDEENMVLPLLLGVFI